MCVQVPRIAADKRTGPPAGALESGKNSGTRRKGQIPVALMMEEKYDDFADLRERAKHEVGKVVIGQDRTVELLLIAAVSHGHVLLEGPPGSAKTLIARAVAHMLGASFKRIQFTPDTTPSELNGVNTIRAGEHVFLPGAVFTNVLLADEINRTMPRTQAALFEPMGERQVTVDGKAHKLPDPFLVIATQNPHEHEGVFPLPEGQLDRFLFKIELDYADAESELSMLNLPHKGIAPDMLGEVRPLLGVVGLDKARQELEHTDVPDSVGRFIVGGLLRPGIDAHDEDVDALHRVRWQRRFRNRRFAIARGESRDGLVRQPNADRASAGTSRITAGRDAEHHRGRECSRSKAGRPEHQRLLYWRNSGYSLAFNTNAVPRRMARGAFDAP